MVASTEKVTSAKSQKELSLMENERLKNLEAALQRQQADNKAIMEAQATHVLETYIKPLLPEGFGAKVIVYYGACCVTVYVTIYDENGESHFNVTSSYNAPNKMTSYMTGYAIRDLDEQYDAVVSIGVYYGLISSAEFRSYLKDFANGFKPLYDKESLASAKLIEEINREKQIAIERILEQVKVDGWYENKYWGSAYVITKICEKRIYFSEFYFDHGRNRWGKCISSKGWLTKADLAKYVNEGKWVACDRPEGI